ncbi:CPXV163 protein [Cowpox virus]|uniref:CPXV163 protein n=1 Tax=Cowpox virus TaxID=10243 RepID=A0A290G6F1_COWPX|nr:CPXV163 protein [Cowpox virus]ATB55642.1 CPXV163 protein [Cowpox virus]
MNSLSIFYCGSNGCSVFTFYPGLLNI